MLVQLAPNSSLTVLPQYVWIKISTDSAVHKIPRSLLNWDRGVLKTKQHGQITEVHDTDPKLTLPPPHFGPPPLPPPVGFGAPPAPPMTDFESIARKHHAIIVTTYDQSTDSNLTAHAATAEGACIHLSLCWLADQKSGADFFSNRVESDSGNPKLAMTTAQAAITHMQTESTLGSGPNLTKFRNNAAQAMGLQPKGTSGMSTASSFSPDPNHITLASGQLFDNLPSYVWARAATDRNYHKIPKTALFWNNGVLKTRNLGQVTELFTENPKTVEEPVFGRGVLERVKASGSNLLMLALRPDQDDLHHGGHAMAIKRNDDSYAIFDPNGGSATFGRYLDAESFFQEYWTSGNRPYSATYDQFVLHRFS